MFLSEFIASYDECDMVISDEEKDTPKPLFLVGDENGDLKMPFNKDILVEKLLEYDRIIKFNANLSQNEEFQKLQMATNLQNSSNLTDLSNLQNYTTANYARIQSTRFHNLLLTPSVKLMINADGWFPYVGASYNFSQKQKGEVTANDTTVSQYKLKNFGELSIGIENTFLKNYSGYVQLSTYVGSSKGVAFQMGVRGYLE